MVITQAQYDEYLSEALEAYRARKGAKSVSFSDQNVQFDSWDEIWKWLKALEGLIPSTARSTVRLASTRKGV